MVPEDFVWCDVRWSTPDRPSEHICAEHEPGHEEHICCCGEVRTT